MAYDILPELPTPNTIPAGPGFVSMTLTDNAPGMIHPLNSGGTIAVKISGNYWTVVIAYPQLTIAEGNTIIPFLYSLQGPFTNFYAQLPIYINPTAGAWAAVPAAAEVSMGAAANQVVITNWAANILASGSTLGAGDMLKFTNTNKIYMVVATSLVGDSMTITLNTEVSDTAAMAAATIEPNDIKFRVRLNGEGPAFALTADGLYAPFSLTLRENVL